MPRLFVFISFVSLLACCGCHRFSSGRWVPAGLETAELLPNPLPVPLVPRELVMDEVSDEIDNYFRILREQRVGLADSVMTEGWIETEPRIGSTILEPWRSDSTPGFERVHATLQTVRRWAKVRVIPYGDRYLIDLQVFKELEDLSQPIKSSVSGQLYRHDLSLDFDRIEEDLSPPNLGWIPMGRDFSLEQMILGNIQERIYQGAKIDTQSRNHH